MTDEKSDDATKKALSDIGVIPNLLVGILFLLLLQLFSALIISYTD